MEELITRLEVTESYGTRRFPRSRFRSRQTPASPTGYSTLSSSFPKRRHLSPRWNASYGPSRVNYNKKLVAAATASATPNKLEAGATATKVAGTRRPAKDNRNRLGSRLIYLIRLRSSTPINTAIRSRGSDVLHSSRDRLQALRARTHAYAENRYSST